MPGGSDGGYPSGGDEGYPTPPHHGTPPPSSSSSSRSQAGIGNQRDKWPPGCLLGHGTPSWEGWHCCHLCSCSWVAHLSPSPALRDTRGRQKQEGGAHMSWQHRGELSPLQQWFCRAGPGHSSHPPFPSCTHRGMFWGERGSSRSRAGRVCPPGNGGQPLLSEGVCTYSCHLQGEIKVYLYSGGFGRCRRSGEGCQGLAGGEIKVPGTQLGSRGIGWRCVIRGAKNPHLPQLQVGFLAQVYCQPFVVGTLQAPPSLGQGGTAWQPWLCPLDLRGRAVFSVDLPEEASSPRRQRPPASRTQPRKSRDT